MSDEDLIDEADELYALPLDDFTGARNALEKSLRKDGRRDEAGLVKALRKPTVPAWALNQVARRQPKDLQKLIAAGRRVREGQEKLLEGGDRKALDSAAAEQRELTKALVRAASAVGEEAGVGTAAAFEEKVGATLRAAAADDAVAARLAAGRLEREQEAVGLFGFGLPAPAESVDEDAEEEPSPRKRRKPKGGGPGTKAQKARREEAAAAREAAAEQRRQEAQERKRLRALESAEKAAERARRAADAAERATAKEEKAAQRAVARLEKAQRDEEQAQAKLEAAAAEVERLSEEGAVP